MPHFYLSSRIDHIPAEFSGDTFISTTPHQKFESGAEEPSVPLAAALVVSSFAGCLVGGAFLLLGGSWRVTFTAYFLIALLPVLVLILRQLGTKLPKFRRRNGREF